ncbi:MAG: hypothetical protein QM669_10015 [Siphonobacter sp.]
MAGNRRSAGCVGICNCMTGRRRYIMHYKVDGLFDWVILDHLEGTNEARWVFIQKSLTELLKLTGKS